MAYLRNAALEKPSLFVACRQSLMKNVWFILAAPVMLAVCAPVPAMAQMPPPRIVSSIDVMVLMADNVAVGKLTEARRVSRERTEVSIAVEQVLKGKPQTTIAVRQDSRSGDELTPEDLSRLVADRARVLVIGDHLTSLRDKGLAIPAANGTRLGEAKQVLAYIQEVVRSHPANGNVELFLIPLPKRLADAPIPRLFDTRNPGPQSPPRTSRRCANSVQTWKSNGSPGASRNSNRH
jgi:hypothetical protein